MGTSNCLGYSCNLPFSLILSFWALDSQISPLPQRGRVCTRVPTDFIFAGYALSVSLSPSLTTASVWQPPGESRGNMHLDLLPPPPLSSLHMTPGLCIQPDPPPFSPLLPRVCKTFPVKQFTLSAVCRAPNSSVSHTKPSLPPGNPPIHVPVVLLDTPVRNLEVLFPVSSSLLFSAHI